MYVKTEIGCLEQEPRRKNDKYMVQPGTASEKPLGQQILIVCSLSCICKPTIVVTVSQGQLPLFQVINMYDLN